MVPDAGPGRARRVLHVLPDLARGGGQGVVLELVRHADRERFEPLVAFLAGPDDLADALAQAGAAPIDLHHRPGRLVQTAQRLRRFLRAEGVDLVHVHSGLDRKVGQLAALPSGTPVVGHLHSPWPHLRPMHGDDAGALGRSCSRAKAAVRAEIERRTVRHYLAVGTEVARFHGALVRAPITTVTNGIDTTRFVPSSATERERARRLVGVPGGGAVLVSVGRLSAGKGQADLVDAIADLPHARLVLVGDGELRAELGARARDLGVGDRVVFAGDRADVAPYLAAADVFAFASGSEGLPLSVLEAMAAGLVVVAYDLPGLRPVIVDGRSGRLVPTGDRRALTRAIESTLADPTGRVAMGRAARAAVVAGYDAASMARAAESVYARVLALPHPRTGRGRDVDRRLAG